MQRFSKYRQKTLWSVKRVELPYFQGTQSSEEDLVVRDRVLRINERIPVREPVTDGKHAPIGQAQNNGSSDNRQEIQVSIDNVRTEGTEDQSVISPSEEALGRNFHVRISKPIRKCLLQYDPGFGAARE